MKLKLSGKMRTVKNTPLLEEIRIMLEAALFHLSEGNLLDVEELLGDAIEDTYEAIQLLQRPLRGSEPIGLQLISRLASVEDCE